MPRTTAARLNEARNGPPRDLLDAIGHGEVTVNDLVDRLGLTQPQVSKHLTAPEGGMQVSVNRLEDLVGELDRTT